ncbi:MAG: hypothetical protein IJI37_05535 [Opitutales bacterium]|nr:hypothetical protein [Opitutales bacterium]
MKKAEIKAVSIKPPTTFKKPSLAGKAAALLQAAGRIARDGGRLAPEDEQSKRRAICAACPHWNAEGNLRLGECEICGCTKYKLAFRSEKCPIGKW